MFCYVCLQRWAPAVGTHVSTYFIESEKERKEAFDSDEILCCGDPECLKVIDALILQGKSIEPLYEEAKRVIEKKGEER